MKFYVNTFPRSGSAGVRALYLLVDELQRRGVAAEAGPVGFGDRDDINVYPEIVDGNPSGAHRVVRWVLATPKAMEMWGPDDLVVTWFDHYLPGHDRLQVDVNPADAFYPKTLPGEDALVWVYKGVEDWDWLHHCGSGRVLTMDEALTLHQLGDELRRADVVYSCDPRSALNTEATLCGTPVLFSPTAAANREPETFWGTLGLAYSPDELPEARREVRWAADHYQTVREAIAGDVDHLLELCGERWGLEHVEPSGGGQGRVLHG